MTSLAFRLKCRNRNLKILGSLFLITIIIASLWHIKYQIPLGDALVVNRNLSKESKSGFVKSVKNSLNVMDLSEKKVVARRFPYINDPLCRNINLSLYEDGTFNITALLSYPGSGNTWTRHLIHLASGVFTGSFYFDIDLLAGGFLGEKETWYSGTTIVQKFHEKYKPLLNIQKAILLIREPIPAIKSFANYLEAGHTGTTFRRLYNHKEWPSFLLESAYNWLSLYKSWLEPDINILVIHYENLRLRPVENVRRICDFINLKCENLATDCFQRKLEGSFRRKISSRINPGKLEFPSELKNIISRGIDYLNNILLKKRLDPMPLNLYEYYVHNVPVNL